VNQNLNNFLKSVGIEELPVRAREKVIKAQYPEVYKTVNEYAKDLGKTTFFEKLYYYANNLTSRPICKYCNNSVTFSRAKKEYHTYCGRKCSIKDVASKLNVTNVSKLPSVKKKKKEKALLKYGVDNVSKAKEVKDKISKKVIQYWADMLNNGILNDYTFKYTSFKEYNADVWKVTEYMYKTYIDIIDPTRCRGNDFHLDHKVSRWQGYLNNILPNIIGHLHNLEMLPASENLKKSYRSSLNMYELYKLIDKGEYNCIELSGKPIIAKIVKFNTKCIGICKYCTGIASYNNFCGEWYCGKSPNSCPANREKNSLKQKASEKKKAATLKRKLLFEESKIS
jgi:hypothetical protein